MTNNNNFNIKSVVSSDNDNIINPLTKNFNNKEIKMINLVINNNKNISNKDLRNILSPGKTITNNNPIDIIPPLIISLNEDLNKFISKDKLKDFNTLVSDNSKNEKVFEISLLNDKISKNDLINIDEQYSNLIELITIVLLKKHNEECFTKKAKVQFTLSKLMLLSVLLKILNNRISQSDVMKNKILDKFTPKISKKIIEKVKESNEKTNNKTKKGLFNWILKEIDSAKDFPSKQLYLPDTASIFSNIIKIVSVSFWLSVEQKIINNANV